MEPAGPRPTRQARDHAHELLGVRRACRKAATGTIRQALRAESLGIEVAQPGLVRLPSRQTAGEAGQLLTEEPFKGLFEPSAPLARGETRPAAAGSIGGMPLHATPPQTVPSLECRARGAFLPDGVVNPPMREGVSPPNKSRLGRRGAHRRHFALAAAAEEGSPLLAERLLDSRHPSPNPVFLEALTEAQGSRRFPRPCGAGGKNRNSRNACCVCASLCGVASSQAYCWPMCVGCPATPEASLHDAGQSTHRRKCRSDALCGPERNAGYDELAQNRSISRHSCPMSQKIGRVRQN